jgi:N-acetylneuraminic acid mutarotase
MTIPQSKPRLPVARDQFTGGVIDGKLYVFGGNGNPDGINLERLDIYDLDTGQWSRGADYDF